MNVRKRKTLVNVMRHIFSRFVSNAIGRNYNIVTVLVYKFYWFVSVGIRHATIFIVGHFSKRLSRPNPSLTGLHSNYICYNTNIMINVFICLQIFTHLSISLETTCRIRVGHRFLLYPNFVIGFDEP